MLSFTIIVGSPEVRYIRAFRWANLSVRLHCRSICTIYNEYDMLHKWSNIEIRGSA